MTHNDIYLPSWTRILLYVLNHKDCIILAISKYTNVTYSHTHIIITQLEQHKLIVRSHKGRSIHVRLTKKGVNLCQNLLRVKKYF